MSSNTSWYPSLRHRARKWVLTNGSVIEEPALEESSSGRRVRLAGEKKTHAVSDASRVAFTGALTMALKTGQRILTEFHPTTADGAHPQLHHAQSPTLHLLENPSSAKWQPSGKTTTYWWRFVQPDLPQIQTVVKIVVTDLGNYYDRTSGAKRQIETTILTPRILPNTSANLASASEGLYSPPPSEVDHHFSTVGREGIHTADFKDWLNANDWPGRALMLAETPAEEDEFWPFIDPDDEVVTKNDDKRALREILRRIRQFDGLESMRVPNFTRLAFPELAKGQPKTWRLHLAGTNVNNDVIDSLVALIEGHDAVNEALEHFEAMQKALRNIGLVLKDVRGTDLLKLLSNTSERFETEVETVIYTADSKSAVEGAKGVRAELPVDHSDHHLSLDLLSGTFVLSCSRRAMDNETLLNMAASEWEEAKTMASITGEESELLAFARAVARREQTAAHAAATAASK